MMRVTGIKMLAFILVAATYETAVLLPEIDH